MISNEDDKKSLMDLLLSMPGGLEMFMQVQSMMQNPGMGTPGTSQRGSTGSTGAGTGTQGAGSGETVTGETEYPYIVYEKPWVGEPKNLVDKRGVELQRGPMRSLMEIARESDVLPGVREMRQIGGGWRLHQPEGNPYAAPEGYSYHQQGLAIDAGWWTEHLARELAKAGWTQFAPGYEPWHWSYGVTG